jgi:hypothetical protein
MLQKELYTTDNTAEIAINIWLKAEQKVQYFTAEKLGYYS